MMKFPHLAQRLFNVPLAIHPRKAEVIVAALAERLGITHIVSLDGQERPTAMMMEDAEMEYSGAGHEPRRGYDLLEGVAVIQVSDTLVHKLGSTRPYSGMTGYDGIRQNLLTAVTDPAVRAICFDVDSPGGEVSGCFDLVDTIYSARGMKPMWSILNENACSGAYAIASATDHITVPRTGITGSIGVICMHVDFSKAIEERGIKVTILQYGDAKADGHPEIPLSKEAAARFQADIDAMGQLFDKTVARNRGVSAAKIRSFQARTFMGDDGLNAGLVDEVLAPDAAFRGMIQSIGGL